jgi:hypothetical protein
MSSVSSAGSTFAVAIVDHRASASNDMTVSVASRLPAMTTGQRVAARVNALALCTITSALPPSVPPHSRQDVRARALDLREIGRASADTRTSRRAAPGTERGLPRRFGASARGQDRRVTIRSRPQRSTTRA